MLAEAIKRNGTSITWLANQLGIKRNTLSLKIHNKRTFKQKEIQDLTVLLKLSKSDMMSIFFED